MNTPTKRCSTCGEVLPLSEFNLRRAAHDGLQSRCRPCSKQWYQDNAVTHRANVRRNSRALIKRNRAAVTDYLLAHPCVDCGERDVRCLDFDHREGTDKITNVCTLVHNAGSWLRILAEIEKRDVRCANCHRRVTVQRGGYWRQQVHEQVAAELAAESLARLERVLPPRVTH
jgi:hypothetical protein